MFKTIKYIIQNAWADKRDRTIIILSIISLIFLFFNCSIVSASTSYDISYQWSDEKYAMTINDLYKLMEECGFNVSGEDFSTYTYVNEYKDISNVTLGGSLNWYGAITRTLSSSTIPVYFTIFNYDGREMFAMLSSYSTSSDYMVFGGSESDYYYAPKTILYNFFDLDNKKVIYGQANSNSNIFKLISYGDMSYAYNNYSNMELSYFFSYAFQQELFLNKFILANGAFYSTDVTIDSSRIFPYISAKGMIVNPITSYRYNGSGEATGTILYNDTLKEWLTIFNNDYFTSGEYAYYLEVREYDYDYIHPGLIDEIYVSDLDFLDTSITYPYSRYLPKTEILNNAIKSYENYQNYCYTLILRNKNVSNYINLSSDLIILSDFFNQHITGFNKLYRYIPYYLYYPDLVSSGDNSGDVSPGDSVVSPSGDNMSIGGGIGGIWQAIINLPKTILDGLVGLFVPPSDYFYNESETDPRFLAAF